MDEELAEHLEATDDGSTDRKPPTLAVSETTPEVLLLLRLVGLAQAQLQSKQEKRINFPPLPMIRTARAAVRARLRTKHRNRLFDQVAEAQARWTALHAAGEVDHPVDARGAQEWIDQSPDPTKT